MAEREHYGKRGKKEFDVSAGLTLRGLGEFRTHRGLRRIIDIGLIAGNLWGEV